MSHDEPPTKRVRKGTKSCVECRHRKVRCIWPSEGADVCQGCQTRGRNCQLQVHVIPSETIRVTSRARLDYLEETVTSLWTVVRSLETRLGYEQAADAPVAPSFSHKEAPQHPDFSDSDTSDISPPNPPTHLLQLFDNDSLGSDRHRSSIAIASKYDAAAPGTHYATGVAALQALMPSRQDMLTITSHTSSWMSLYSQLFPMIMKPKFEEMLQDYDRLQTPTASPVAIAALLLAVAVAIQQLDSDNAARPLSSITNPASFLIEVSDTVERVVINDDVLAGTLEGIETTLIFLRLQLGRAKLRKMWLQLRRVIALAELIGLPRASMANASSHPQQPTPTTRRAEVWESICTLDRITCLMWSLPLATAHYPLPKRPIVDSHGHVVLQSFLYSLTDIASSVLDLDSIRSSGKPLSDVVKAVIVIDQDLRSLANLAPKAWWKIHWSEMNMDAVAQHSFQYLTVRTHLQLALAYDEGHQFMFNFVACADACTELARRYTSLRPILPAGFFANWVVDLQAFTAATFLLLASDRASRTNGNHPQAIDVSIAADLIDQVVRTMETAANQIGSAFARQPASSIRALRSLLHQPQTSNEQKMTLNLPLVGRIHISRKSHAGKAVQKPQNHFPASARSLNGSWATDSNSISSFVTPQASSMTRDMDLMDAFSYSMELPDNFAFLADETFGSEQWLTLMGWDGKG